MKREKVKALIILSMNTKEADLQIEKFLGNVSVKEKIAFLRGMFDVQIISECEQTKDEKIVYEIMLDSILTSYRES